MISYLQELASVPEIVVIGECGLDCNRDFSPRPQQKQWFEAQLQLACDLKLPVSLHERDARRQFLEIFAPYRNQLKAAVVHCFTGDGKELKAYLNWNLHIGITSWICDERWVLHLQELVHLIPLNRLMLGTDAPYLLPRMLRLKPRGEEMNQHSCRMCCKLWRGRSGNRLKRLRVQPVELPAISLSSMQDELCNLSFFILVLLFGRVIMENLDKDKCQYS